MLRRRASKALAVGGVSELAENVPVKLGATTDICMPTSDTTVSPFLSQKFRFWSFVSMVLLVFVHGYTVEPRYLQPWTFPQELPLGFTSFTEYLLANGLLRFRIPMLFAISGFLFALHDSTPHVQRMRKRVRTLLVPYFAWSGLMLLLICGLEMHPTTRGWLVANGLNQMNETKVLLHDYAWTDWLGRWLVFPAPYQLWFLQALFFLNLVYPLIRMVSGSRAGRWGCLFVFMLWLSSAPVPFIQSDGLVFFTLGVLIQKAAFNLEQPPRWLNPWLWGVMWLTTGAVKTWLAFGGDDLLGEAVFPLMGQLHKICVLSGVIAAWFGGDALVRFFMPRPWFVWLTGFSFMIYVVHAPMVAVLIDPTLRALSALPDPHLATFILLPLALIAISVMLGVVLRTWTPSVYGWLTGGRGLAA